ncbi:hypothetical protein BH10CYA1_BH10CYA1_12220 [soil metagenome]
MFEDDRSIAELMQPQTEEEKAADSQKYHDFKLDLFNDDVEDRTQDSELRSLVAFDDWFVQIDGDGNYDLVIAAPEEFLRAVKGLDPATGKRKVKRGRGGKLVCLFHNQPDKPSKKIRGRDFARSVPTGIDGLLVHRVDTEPEELDSEFLHMLPGVADSIDVAQSLFESEPIDTTALKKHMWITQIVDEGGVLCYSTYSSAHVSVAFLDAAHDLEEVRHKKLIDGASLMRTVLEKEYLDGLELNGIAATKFGANRVTYFALSLSFLSRALNLERCYFQVHSPVTRSRAELELWLRLSKFPQDREIVEAVDATTGDTVLYATSKTPTDAWRAVETLYPQQTKAMVRTLSFALRPDSSSSYGFGSGASQILCPGLLAQELFCGAARKQDGSISKHIGKSYLIGRAFSDADQSHAREMLLIGAELLKLFSPDHDRLERKAILTVRGAEFLRSWPVCGTRSWVEQTIEYHKKCLVSWMWGNLK